MFNIFINLFNKLIKNQDIRKFKKNFLYYLLFRLIRKRLKEKIKIKIYSFNIWASHKKNKQSHSILRKCDFEDLQELKLIEKIFLKKKIFLFDCGSNFGFYSLFVASLSHNNKIFSFEASPSTYEDFKENIKLNNFKNIKPFNVVVSDIKKSETDFLESENDWESSLSNKNFKVLKSTKIESTSLDYILENQNDNFFDYEVIIKLDVEGHEMNILKGASKLIKNFSPIIIIEFSKFIKDDDYKSMRKFLYENDYLIYDPSYKEITLDTVINRLNNLPQNMYAIGNNFLIKKDVNINNIIKNA